MTPSERADYVPLIVLCAVLGAGVALALVLVLFGAKP